MIVTFKQLAEEVLQRVPQPLQPKMEQWLDEEGIAREWSERKEKLNAGRHREGDARKAGKRKVEGEEEPPAKEMKKKNTFSARKILDSEKERDNFEFTKRSTKTKKYCDTDSKRLISSNESEERSDGKVSSIERHTGNVSPPDAHTVTPKKRTRGSDLLTERPKKISKHCYDQEHRIDYRSSKVGESVEERGRGRAASWMGTYESQQGGME
ncbi:hypothetical protein GWK47_027986 [Chionoecetes opilio]|uniref:Uncharacterized protein n=1 Tax=Chionoecetes opilio TaxID=41210 RepID=A0A8J5D3R2_CHIOP|nr:hypothetical protein GWK47_027986 [Chionoecetes opilio]